MVVRVGETAGYHGRVVHVPQAVTPLEDDVAVEVVAVGPADFSLAALGCANSWLFLSSVVMCAPPPVCQGRAIIHAPTCSLFGAAESLGPSP